MPVRVAVVFHSGYGHTGRQAESVARARSRSRDTEVSLIPLGANLTDEQWETLEKANAMIFGSPTYMGHVHVRGRRMGVTDRNGALAAAGDSS